MVEGTAAQADGWTVKALERWRDDCLIRLLEVLEPLRRDRIQAPAAEPVP